MKRLHIINIQYQRLALLSDCGTTSHPNNSSSNTMTPKSYPGRPKFSMTCTRPQDDTIEISQTASGHF